ncbi:hypothetical protein GCM10009836_42400 [Pseudonocardia ailaonensis]|uniref:STAS domain-containing protein n=2 Tax=Pseudonocardia ailaonensis TaxID=367279 RepID=A0ABN2NBS8_9PSEU
MAGEPGAVEIDLDDVTFLDVGCARAIEEYRPAAAGRGRSVRVTGAEVLTAQILAAVRQRIPDDGEWSGCRAGPDTRRV